MADSLHLDSNSASFSVILDETRQNNDLMAARLGRLALKQRHVLDTPNFLAVTSRGVVPHIAPDVMRGDFSASGVYVALEDFIERSTTEVAPIMNTPVGPKSPLHTFIALPSPVISCLAPRRTPAVECPVGNSNSEITIFTSTGFQTLKVSNYSKYVAKLQPDIVVAMGDIPHGTHPGTKRKVKMEDRTCKWLGDLLSDLKYLHADTPASKPAVFAPILPLDAANQPEYLTTLSDEFSDRITGLAFYNSSVLPDIPATSRLSALLRLSLDIPASPHQILQQISLGMDIFTVPFINAATDSGIALTFEFPKPTNVLPPATSTNGLSILPLGVDMWSEEHVSSQSPIIPSCTCYTCTKHSRAYIRHLLQAKEMLAWTLLQIHNHACISDFFAAVRHSIAQGSFDTDCEIFASTYDSELPAQTGQGPRQRGYHAKTRGPNESKKNKPAWGALGVFE